MCLCGRGLSLQQQTVQQLVNSEAVWPFEAALAVCCGAAVSHTEAVRDQQLKRRRPGEDDLKLLHDVRHTFDRLEV